MLSLGLFTPDLIDSTSLYRAVGPFSALKNEVNLILLPSNGKIKWPALASCDVLFAHRPNNQEHFDMISQASLMGIPVWIDLDDAYLDLDYANDAYEYYKNPQIAEGLKNAVGKASIITVTTPKLQEIWSKYNSRIKIIENEIPIHLIKKSYLEPILRNSNLFCWRGTAHHLTNLNYFQSGIANAFNDCERWPWVFMGLKPAMFSDCAPVGRIVQSACANQWIYFEHLHEQRAAVQVVALKDSLFNQCKSDIAYQEALLFARSLCVVPDFGVWSNLPGTINYSASDGYDTSSKQKNANESLRWAIKKAYNMTESSRNSLTIDARKTLINSLLEMKYVSKRREILHSLLSLS